MTALIADRLRSRVRSGGAGPLLTYYDLATGERTELSATSFLNWVDKTSNLLVDDYLPSPGAVVDLELARQAPGHWVTLVVELAAWQVGATVRVGESSGSPADLLVLGPDWAGHDLSRGDSVLACSLHPLGLGFASPLPTPVADFSVEVRGQSDVHLPTPRTGSELAWVDDQRRLTQRDLVSGAAVTGAAAGLGVGAMGAAVADTAGQPVRRLVPVGDPWACARDGLLTPLLDGGSAVLVVGQDPQRLARIRQDERVDV